MVSQGLENLLNLLVRERMDDFWAKHLLAFAQQHDNSHVNCANLPHSIENATQLYCKAHKSNFLGFVTIVNMEGVLFLLFGNYKRCSTTVIF